MTKAVRWLCFRLLLPLMCCYTCGYTVTGFSCSVDALQCGRIAALQRGRIAVWTNSGRSAPQAAVMDLSWAAVAPPSTALIAPGAPRSEHDPERAVLAADTITMHRLTGTFTDPSHEQTFAALLFRLAFPIHVLSLTLSFVAVSVGDMHVAWSSPISPTVSQWGAWVTASLTLVLSLVRPA